VEVLFEILFNFLGELLLQLVFEILVEAGLHVLREPFRKTPHAAVAAIGYAIFGAAAGGISLLVVPRLFFHSEAGRIGNLLLAPIVAGLVMTGLGLWRTRREQDLIRLDRFACGYLFALAMAAVRFAFGR